MASARSKVICPVSGYTPGLVSAPSSVMRCVVNSFTKMETCGSCRKFLLLYCSAIKASASDGVRPATLSVPISGMAICPLVLTRTVRFNSLTPNTSISSRSLGVIL